VSYPDLLLMAMSAHAGGACQAKARAAGMEHYFVKPVAVAKLCDVLRGLRRPNSPAEP
jgi:CheY-like chemotaxis protein